MFVVVVLLTLTHRHNALRSHTGLQKLMIQYKYESCWRTTKLRQFISTHTYYSGWKYVTKKRELPLKIISSLFPIGGQGERLQRYNRPARFTPPL